jgi:hypothetical protein
MRLLYSSQEVTKIIRTEGVSNQLTDWGMMGGGGGCH